MSYLSQFHFLRPACLLFLPIIVLVWWWIRKSKDPLSGWRSVIRPELLKAFVIGDQGIKRWRTVGMLFAWVMATVAIAGPTFRPQPSPFADDPYPVMIALKADESMNLSDIAPSRMERARLKVSDLANHRKGLPTGLMAFAGTAHLVLPPTRDTAVVATMAVEINPDIMPKPGEDLVAALNRAESALEGGRGSIVLFLDTVPSGNEAAISEFRKQSSANVAFLAVASEGSPELESIRAAAKLLGASVTVMTADDSDIDELVRRTTKASESVAGDDRTVRWAEAGWWFVPIIALVALAGFRRTDFAVNEAA